MSVQEVIGSYGDLDAEAVEVAAQAARRTFNKYRDYVELADLESEALLLILSKDGYADLINQRDYGYLQHTLERDLMDHCEMAFHVPRNDQGGRVIRPDHTAIARRGSVTINADGQKVYQQTHVSHDECGDDGDERVNLYEETVPGGYTEEQVRLLLPAVWDESYAYSLPDTTDQPDSDMPRAASNKARSNSHWAYIADIKTAWNKTPLTLLERRSLLMCFGLAWTHEQIAQHEGVARPTVTVRINTGIKKLTARLNGALLIEEE